MAVTAADVAKSVGLSRPTVSRILRNEGQAHTEATRQLVMEAAARLGYRPNASARVMRSGRHGAIGLLKGTASDRSTVAHGTLFAIEQKLLASDMNLVMNQVPDEKLIEQDHVPKLLREWGVDGLLISYSVKVPPRLPVLVEQLHIPAVWINAKRKTDCVYPDDYSAGAAAAKRMLKLGHRHIAYLGPAPKDNHYSVADRLEGCAAAVGAAGGKLTVIHAPAGSIDEVQRLTAALKGKDRVTGLVTYSSAELPAILHILPSWGLRLGPDVSLVAIREEPHTLAGIEISAMIIPTYGVGYAAVDLLMKKLGKAPQKAPGQALPYIEHEGKTCLKPPRS